MGKAELTFQIDEDLKAAFSAAAEAEGRSVADLLREVIQGYLDTQVEDYDTWFHRQVQIGLDEAEAGQLIPAEEVEAEFALKRAETLRKLGGETA